MKFELMDLPYEQDALSPFIGVDTVKIHHQKHHGGYVKKLEKALSDDPKREATLEEIIIGSSQKADAKVFNLAAQIWNHDFYWLSLSPGEVAKPAGAFGEQITQSFGSLDSMLTEFSAAAASEFGSGWAWIVYCPEPLRGANGASLEVCSTSDAGNPMTAGKIPLLTLDVWEHAYYLDYQNERARYIKEFLEGHANWEFATANFSEASAER